MFINSLLILMQKTFINIMNLLINFPLYFVKNGESGEPYIQGGAKYFEENI